MMAVSQLTWTALDRTIGWALVHFTWQGAIIAAMLAIALPLLKRRSAQDRYLAGCVALCLMLACPLVTAWKVWQDQSEIARNAPARVSPAHMGKTLPGRSVAAKPVPLKTAASKAPTAPPANPVTKGTAGKSKPVAAIAPTADRKTAQAKAGVKTKAKRKRRPPNAMARFINHAIPWIVLVWISGVAVLTVRFFGGWVRLMGTVRAGIPADDAWQHRLSAMAEHMGIHRPVKLMTSMSIAGPILIGWLKPVVFVPVSALTGMNSEQISAVLAHELAHVRRCDFLVNLLQSILEVFLFYHPAVWWVSRRVRIEREHCCDDMAVATCGNSLTYVRALTEIEELRGFPARPAVAAAGGSLLGRAHRLLGRNPDKVKRPWRLRDWIIVTVLVAAILAPLAPKLLGYWQWHVQSKNLARKQKEQQAKTRKRMLKARIFSNASSGKLDSLRQKLHEHPEWINIIDRQGRTLLHKAAGSPKGAETVAFLLENDIKTDIRDKQGRLATHYYTGSPKTAQIFVSHGVKLDVFASAGHNMTEQLARILKDDPSLTGATDPSKRTALDHATETQATEAAKLLLKSGAKPNIYWAAMLSMPQDIARIVKADKTAASSEYARRAIHEAVEKGDTAVVQALLQAGVSANSLLKGKPRLLHTATQKNNAEIAKLLRDSGATPVLTYKVMNKENGKPLAGVSLALYTTGSNPTSRATTDALGVGVLDIPIKTPRYTRLDASKAGFVLLRTTFTPGAIPPSMTVSMEPPVAIGGIVKNEQGQPVPGVTVSVSYHPSRSVGTQTIARVPRKSVKTDKNGKWRFVGMPKTFDGPGQLDPPRIFVQHPDYLSDFLSRGCIPMPVTPMPAVAKLKDLTSVMILKRGITFKGVVFGKDNKPVAGATVSEGDSNWNARKTTTNKAGQYVLARSKPGWSRLSITAPGYAPESVKVLVRKGIKNRDFHLKVGRTIKARVVNAAGKPIVGAGVQPQLGHSNWLDVSMKTDSTGRFTWKEAPQEEVKFDVWARGYMRVTKFPATPSDKEYVITMYPPLKISGTVVDAETGKPIKKFSLLPGISWNPDKEPLTKTHWQYRNIRQFANGKYTTSFNHPYPGHLLRIESPGYTPSVSRAFKKGEHGNLTFHFKLIKGTNINGTVVLPTGKPAPGAQIALTTGNNLQVYNGRFRHHGNARIATSDSAGKFSFPAECGQWRMLILHDSGYADIKSEQLKKSKVVTLTPWGRIEGIVKIGTKPASGAQMSAWQVERGQHFGKPMRVYWQYNANADKDGKFVFDRMMAAEFSVYRQIQCGPMRYTSSGSTRVTVASGKTLHMTIGGTGRPIIGKVKLPASRSDLAFTNGHSYISTKISPAWKVPVVPADWNTMSTADRMKHAAKEWKDFDLGKKIKLLGEKLRAKRKQFGLFISDDGTFRVEDVPAGTYEINITLMEPGRPGSHMSAAMIRKDVTIASMPSGRSDEPLDLGTLQLVAVSNSARQGLAAAATHTSTQAATSQPAKKPATAKLPILKAGPAAGTAPAAFVLSSKLDYPMTHDSDDCLTAIDSSGSMIFRINKMNFPAGISTIALDEKRDSFWVNEYVNKRILKYDMSGKLLLQIPDVAARSLTVHDETGNLWLIIAPEDNKGMVKFAVQIYDPSGKLIATPDVSGHKMVYNAEDKAFWITNSMEIIRLSADGTLLNRTPMAPWSIFSFTTIAGQKNVWAGEYSRSKDHRHQEYRLALVTPDGKTLTTVALGQFRLGVIACDPKTADLLVSSAYTGFLARVSSDGKQVWQYPFAATGVDVAADGTVWAVTKKNILKLDYSGKVLSKVPIGLKAKRSWIVAIKSKTVATN